MRPLWIGLLLYPALLLAQPIAMNPVVEVKGKIARVQIVPGQGMPYLEVWNGSGSVKVRLGSIRYLMDQNFRLKAGQVVVVKGYKLKDEVVAITVHLPTEKKELRLRDDKGRPLWIRARYGP